MSSVAPSVEAAHEIKVFPSFGDRILVTGFHSDDVLNIRCEPSGQIIRPYGVAAGSASPVKFHRGPLSLKYGHGTPIALSSAAPGSTPATLKEDSSENLLEYAVASWRGPALSPSYWPSGQPDVKTSSDTAAVQYPHWVLELFRWALVLACASLLLLAVNFIFWGSPYLLGFSACVFGLAAALATAAFVKADKEDRARSA